MRTPPLPPPPNPHLSPHSSLPDTPPSLFVGPEIDPLLFFSLVYSGGKRSKKPIQDEKATDDFHYEKFKKQMRRFWEKCVTVTEWASDTAVGDVQQTLMTVWWQHSMAPRWLLQSSFVVWQYSWTTQRWSVEVLLYVHRNRRLIRDGSPGQPPRLSHSSWTRQLSESYRMII